MTNPTLSIIIPHKPGNMNNMALQLNLDALLRNTVSSFELIIDTQTPCDPYKIWNAASILARGDILVFTNSDVIMAPGWDEMFVKHMVDNAILTGYLVEPGNIGVAPINIHQDFGKTPVEFQSLQFERFAEEHGSNKPEILAERGWYMPCAFLKDWFNWTGGFDTTLGFPHPNDILFWEHCRTNLGTSLYRVRSYAYHFQGLTHRDV